MKNLNKAKFIKCQGGINAYEYPPVTDVRSFSPTGETSWREVEYNKVVNDGYSAGHAQNTHWGIYHESPNDSQIAGINIDNRNIKTGLDYI